MAPGAATPALTSLGHKSGGIARARGFVKTSAPILSGETSHAGEWRRLARAMGCMENRSAMAWMTGHGRRAGGPQANLPAQIGAQGVARSLRDAQLGGAFRSIGWLDSPPVAAAVALIGARAMGGTWRDERAGGGAAAGAIWGRYRCGVQLGSTWGPSGVVLDLGSLWGPYGVFVFVFLLLGRVL